MCIPKCIVEIHAASEHFLICNGYYYGVDTYWSLWKSIWKAGGDTGACNVSVYATPTVYGHVCMAACGAVHKYTGLLSSKRFFYRQTGVERHQPTPAPDKKIHPNIYFSWPCSEQMIWIRRSPEVPSYLRYSMLADTGQMSMLSISSLKFQDITTSKNLSLSKWKRRWGEDRCKWNAWIERSTEQNKKKRKEIWKRRAA